ncbi:MAG: ATP-binding cassette domain-containing protein, partial [Cytophagales bacterium]|nr:ATP-binding cassette domain-containing protein [Rhizobacter sp.]
MAELLRVEQLRAGYGEAVVVQGIDLTLEQGQSLALLGRNGTGKTTLMNSLVGVTRRHAGRIFLAGKDITALTPHQRAAAGIGWVPQERNIFKSLTVHENLTAVARPGKWGPDRVYEMFPRLAERKT